MVILKYLAHFSSIDMLFQENYGKEMSSYPAGEKQLLQFF